MTSTRAQVPEPAPPTVVNPNRVLRIAAVAVLILGLEWRLAEPAIIAGDPERWPLPLAMLAVMFPVAIGVWAFETSNPDGYGYRLDLLWSLLLGTVSYCLFALFALFT